MSTNRRLLGRPPFPPSPRSFRGLFDRGLALASVGLASCSFAARTFDGGRTRGDSSNDAAVARSVSCPASNPNCSLSALSSTRADKSSNGNPAHLPGASRHGPMVCAANAAWVPPAWPEGWPTPSAAPVVANPPQEASPGPGATAGVSPASTPAGGALRNGLSDRRARCSFGPGTLADDTIGDLEEAKRHLQHVIILTQENHSFDNMYGMTKGMGLDTIPGDYFNLDRRCHQVRPFHFATACPTDIPHSPSAFVSAYNKGAMNNFYRSSGTRALGFYTDDDHPYYTWLLKTFATSDRYFAAALGPTWPNRQILYSGVANPNFSSSFPLGQRTLFDELDAKGVSWGDYVDGNSYLDGSLGWKKGHRGVHPYQDLISSLEKGDPPSVAFVDTEDDEHPSHSIHDGENFVRDLLSHVFASPAWSSTVVIINYDEGGGFFDHVPPPPACAPSRQLANLVTYGVRVPLFVISPFSRAGFISHEVHSHSSVTRLVEALFDLPALSRRDANADALLDMFDFSEPAFPAAPADAPDPAPRGCAIAGAPPPEPVPSPAPAPRGPSQPSVPLGITSTRAFLNLEEHEPPLTEADFADLPD